MDGKRIPSAAAITFASAREAGRRVAGVPAAARIAREVAQAGFAQAWLLVPDGETIDRSTLAEVACLAGTMALRTKEPLPQDIAVLPGDRLIPAAAIPAFLANEPGPLAGVIDLAGRGATLEILRRTGKASDGPVSRWLNRPVSRLLSALLLKIPGLTPLHATSGTAILALLMFGALTLGGAAGLVAGALLFHAASVFDGVDGEVARATFRSSRSGAALDTLVDTATTLLFLTGVTINLGSFAAQASAMWGIGLFLLGTGLLHWRRSRASGPFSLDLIKHHYKSRFSGALIPPLIAFLTVVSSRDFFALLFAVLIVAGLPIAVLYIFAAAASVWICFVAALLIAQSSGALAPERV